MIGSGIFRGRISYFSIDLRCRPWNTLALPCQRVMRDNRVDRIIHGLAC